MASLVQLELDEGDKENFQQLQTQVGEAQSELAVVNHKLRTRNADGKHAQLTLAELDEIPDATTAYEQARARPLSLAFARGDPSISSVPPHLHNPTCQAAPSSLLCCCCMRSFRVESGPRCPSCVRRRARPFARAHASRRPARRRRRPPRRRWARCSSSSRSPP